MAALIGFGSDVARLVLGYLQAENLLDVSRAFCRASPHLQEEWGTLSHSINMSNETTLLNRLREHLQIKYLISQFVDQHVDRYMDHPLVNELSTLRRIEMILMATDFTKIRCAEKRRFSEIHEQSSHATTQPEDLPGYQHGSTAKRQRISHPFVGQNETTPSLQNTIPKCTLSSIKKPTTPLSTLPYGPSNSTITSTSLSFLNDPQKFHSPNDEQFYCDPSLLSNSMFQNTAFQNVIANAINDRMQTPRKDAPNGPSDVDKMIADIIATTERDPTFEDVVNDCVQSIRLNHSNRMEPSNEPTATTSTPHKSDTDESEASSIPIKRRLRNRKSQDTNIYTSYKRPYRKANTPNTSTKSNPASEINVISNETYTGDLILVQPVPHAQPSDPVTNFYIINSDGHKTTQDGQTYMIYAPMNSYDTLAGASSGAALNHNQLPLMITMNQANQLNLGDVIDIQGNQQKGITDQQLHEPLVIIQEMHSNDGSQVAIREPEITSDNTTDPLAPLSDSIANNLPSTSTSEDKENQERPRIILTIPETPPQHSQLNKSKAKSLSTPRRISHVRALNFSTPYPAPAPLPEREAANMTPAYSKTDLTTPASAPPKMSHDHEANNESDLEATNRSSDSMDGPNDFFARDIDEATVVSVRDLSIADTPLRKRSIDEVVQPRQLSANKSINNFKDVHQFAIANPPQSSHIELEQPNTTIKPGAFSSKAASSSKTVSASSKNIVPHKAAITSKKDKNAHKNSDQPAKMKVIPSKMKDAPIKTDDAPSKKDDFPSNIDAPSPKKDTKRQPRRKSIIKIAKEPSPSPPPTPVQAVEETPVVSEPNPADQLEEWQRLRSIKSTEWDNHLRQELSRTGSIQSSGRRNITKRRKKKFEPLQSVNSCNGSIDQPNNDASLIEQAKRLDAALVTPQKPEVDPNTEPENQQRKTPTRQKKYVIKLGTPSKSTTKQKKSSRKKSATDSTTKRSAKKNTSIANDQDFVHPDNITPPDAGRPPLPTPAKPINAHMNLASLLETPLKNEIPPTPRLLPPSSCLTTPVVRLQRLHNDSLIKCPEFPTPDFPITPGAKTTPPHPASASARSGPTYGRATDYSSGSSYYRPDESEDIDHNITVALRNTTKDLQPMTDQDVCDEAMDVQERVASPPLNSSTDSSSNGSSSGSSSSSSSSSSEDDDSDVEEDKLEEKSAILQAKEREIAEVQRKLQLANEKEEEKRRLDHQTRQAKHLDEVRLRMIANLKKDTATERIKAQAPLAHRKGRLAMKQGFTAAVAASKQKPSVPEQRRLAKAKTLSTKKKTPAKQTVPTQRKVICLKEAIPATGRTGKTNLSTRCRPKVTSPRKKVNPKENPVTSGLYTSVIYDDEPKSPSHNDDNDLSPPDANTYSPNAETSHSAKFQDIFGDFTMSDSDINDTPVKTCVSVQDDRCSEVLPALSLMPTPQKQAATMTPKKTTPESNKIKCRVASSDGIPKHNLSESKHSKPSKSNAKTPQKMTQCVQDKEMVTEATVVKRDKSVSLFEDIQMNESIQNTIEKRQSSLQSADVINHIESELTEIRSIALIGSAARKQTPKTDIEGIIQLPNPIADSSDNSRKSDLMKMPTNKQWEEPISEDDALSKSGTSETALVSFNKSDSSVASVVQSQPTDQPQSTTPVKAQSTPATATIEDDGESSSGEEVDPYDECSLVPSWARTPHCGEFNLITTSTHQPETKQSGLIQFPPFKINMDGNVFRFSVNEESVLFTRPPKPHKPDKLSSNKSNKSTRIDKPPPKELGPPLQCSTPAEKKLVPKMKISHKQKGHEIRVTTPQMPERECAQKKPSTHMELNSSSLRSLNAVDPTPKIRNMDINLVLGKIHPSTSQR